MENRITKSLVIIGGGPAGLAAAVAAAENGLPAEDILILERDGRHLKPVHPQRLRSAHV